ncbi:MAG TPA: FAD-dependent monooxygenase [Gaiellaceae bacterium]|nr:FAD-dependent monooxygenase [Gaiellaceae bacterium]
MGGRRAFWARRHRSRPNVLVRHQERAGRRVRRAPRQEGGDPAPLLGLARADRSSRRGSRRCGDSPQRRLLPRAAPRWSNGRVVLVGDAAHATTPAVGQGAAQAIEDAVVLADRLADSADLATALDAYEAIRRPRAEAVLKMSRRADKAAQLASPLGSRLRDAVVRRLPERAQRRQLEPLVRYEL